MKRLVLLVIILIPVIGWAQNLVPNSSFEEYHSCPNTAGEFSLKKWYSTEGSPDYYDTCATFLVGIPVSWGGGGYANSGDAYVGIAVWSKTLHNGREFFSTKLTEPLIPGKKYNVEFYVSLMDSMWYATKNIGVYFSVDSVERQLSNNFFFSKSPQIKYTGPEYLTDKEGWMKVQGSFFADSNVQFITIGNFDDDAHTDTFLVSSIIYSGMIKSDAYYYIDDVLVELDTTTGINDASTTLSMTFNVYPNPAKGLITLETVPIAIGITKEVTTLQIVDITGRVVSSTSLSSSKTTIDVSAISAGVYIAVLEQGGKAIARRKIVVE